MNIISYIYETFIMSLNIISCGILVFVSMAIQNSCLNEHHLIHFRFYVY